MKRLFAAMLCLCLLTGCGQTGGTGDTHREEEPGSGAMTEEKAESGGELFRVIRAENDAALLLAKEDSGPAGVYTLSPADAEAAPESETAAPNGVYTPAYTPGTLLEITYGSVLETYPAKLAEVTAVHIRSDGFDDRCALYLRVLNDLWTVDEGLNHDVTAVSVDLSATSLSESEQAAVAWAFGGEHGISEVLSLSYEELAAEGYLTGAEPGADSLPYWENGCLLSITERETGDNELNGARNTVTFDAQKWRSALGAYFFADCTAEQALDGHWGDYTVGSEAIS